MEASRGILELKTTTLNLPLLQAMSQEGCGIPVLAIPGFGRDDFSMDPLRRFLESINNPSYGWDYGRNINLDKPTIDHLVNLIGKIRKEHNGAKVNLVGHSLGGIIARELSRAMPEHINQVITLGSPFGCLEHKKSITLLLRKLIEHQSPFISSLFGQHDIATQLQTPPPVPTTSIYTKGDGAVNWRTCLNPKTPHTENIQVKGSHAGLSANPVALFVVADRLGQPEDKWEPFVIGECPDLILEDEEAEQHVSCLTSDSCEQCLPFFSGPPLQFG
jgi:pimeloyl-ACP methyl ester carboxylesterase